MTVGPLLIFVVPLFHFLTSLSFRARREIHCNDLLMMMNECRSGEVAGECSIHIVDADAKFDLGTSEGSIIVYVPTLRLIAVAEGSSVHIHSLEGALRGVFERHAGNITRIVLLYDDVLLSVGKNGSIFAWKASSRNVLDGYVNENYEFWTVEKRSDSRVAVGVNLGRLRVFSHERGRNIKLVSGVEWTQLRYRHCSRRRTAK